MRGETLPRVQNATCKRLHDWANLAKTKTCADGKFGLTSPGYRTHPEKTKPKTLKLTMAKSAKSPPRN